MSDKQLSWKFAEDLVVEPAHIALARQHSLEVGVEPVTPAVGAQLALMVAASGAKNIIEIGTGLGVSTLWMLSGATDAVITTIDSEADHQLLARKAVLDAGIHDRQVRFIGGRATDVLPRMNEGSYDLVFVDADPRGALEYVEAALRLVRRGGTVAVAHALWRDKVADPAQRDDTVIGFRMLLAELAASDAVVVSLSTAGDGLLLVTRLAD